MEGKLDIMETYWSAEIGFQNLPTDHLKCRRDICNLIAQFGDSADVFSSNEIGALLFNSSTQINSVDVGNLRIFLNESTINVSVGKNFSAIFDYPKSNMRVDFLYPYADKNPTVLKRSLDYYPYDFTYKYSKIVKGFGIPFSCFDIFKHGDEIRVFDSETNIVDLTVKYHINVFDSMKTTDILFMVSLPPDIDKSKIINLNNSINSNFIENLYTEKSSELKNGTTSRF